MNFNYIAKCTVPLFSHIVVSIDANLRIELDPDNDYSEGGNVSFLCITNGPDAPRNPRWRKGDFHYIQSSLFGEHKLESESLLKGIIQTFPNLKYLSCMTEHDVQISDVE